MADQGLQLAEQVAATQSPLRLHGGDSKHFYGNNVEGNPLDLSQHRGVISYEPTELVLTARCGTPLTEIDNLLRENQQMLSFEPAGFTAKATLGGTIASGLAGPRRPWGGAPRDQVLGLHLLDSQGHILRFGGEVMKNVAGYDVSRLMAGAQGTLGILLDISLKVLPAPAIEQTLLLENQHGQAVDLMRKLSSGPAPLSAACHYEGQTRIRLSGNASSVSAWAKRIGGELQNDNEFWQRLNDQQLDFFDTERPLWRLSLPPGSERLPCETEVLTDWAGAQRWVYSDCGQQEIRQQVAKTGGHAILFRNGEKNNNRFHPLDPIALRLHKGLKKTFDPKGIFNPGRLYPDF